ncbi:alpha/beta hydrolase [Planctomycetales bacterium ZRK34]|nr:alpha/beta hydrolase [Planctomycetales bacterium ZRK34]
MPTGPEDVQADYEVCKIEDSSKKLLELWALGGADPEGPCVVVLHGWGDSRLGALAWYDTLKPIAGRIILYDQRAHGESAQRRCTAGRREADDAAVVARWLKQREPDRAVVLFGYSMGAAIGIDAAIECGEVVDAVIADSPYRNFTEALATTLRASALPARGIAPAAAWLARVPGELIAERAAQMKQPLLVLHGTGDIIASHDEARRIAQAAPRGRFVEFEGAGHLQASSDHPQEYDQALRRFVGEVTAEKKARPTET